MVIEWPWRSCQPERRDAQRWAAHTDVDVTFDADLDFLVSAPDVLIFASPWRQRVAGWPHRVKAADHSINLPAVLGR
jgi:hypothetical protein